MGCWHPELVPASLIEGMSMGMPMVGTAMLGLLTWLRLLKLPLLIL
jgi:hypothetical protein